MDITYQTREIKSGDELLFKVIPPNEEDANEHIYYERVIDNTFTIKNGLVVRLNSIGDIGQTPKIYFAFSQNERRDIYYYGSVVATDIDDLSTMSTEEWVIEPEEGCFLNYPGTYCEGMKWTTSFKTENNLGQFVHSHLINTVHEMEKISIQCGDFEAFKIVTVDDKNETESVSWFSTKLGINIKRHSYSSLKPGYELFKYNFK